MTREDIEQLNAVNPDCFETYREAQWYQVGLQDGLEVADANPKSPWISVEDKLPCDDKEMVMEYVAGLETRTKKVCVLLENGFTDITYMYRLPPCGWHWNIRDTITHWFPIPELPKE